MEHFLGTVLPDWKRMSGMNVSINKDIHYNLGRNWTDCFLQCVTDGGGNFV